jgi:hypothetical protein
MAFRLMPKLSALLSAPAISCDRTTDVRRAPAISPSISLPSST